MKRGIWMAVLFVLSTCQAYGAGEATGAVRETVKRIDTDAKVLVVETDKGLTRTFVYADDLTVHGSRSVSRASSKGWKGIREGSETVVHYSSKAGKDTAHEVDLIGERSLSIAKGTLSHLNRATKALTIKTEGGTEQTFKLTEHAAVDGGRDIAKDSEKSAKITVYYTTETGHKVAHFFD